MAWAPIAVQKILEASTGFSTFELLYGSKPRGILEKSLRKFGRRKLLVVKIQYVLDLRAKQSLNPREFGKSTKMTNLTIIMGCLAMRICTRYNMLILLPMVSSKLFAKWQGPFGWVGNINYEVKLKDETGCNRYTTSTCLNPWGRWSLWYWWQWSQRRRSWNWRQV